MQKIGFCDRYGLTKAVLNGIKTTTRRTCKDKATGDIIYAKDVDSVRFYAEDNIVEFVMTNGDIKVSVPRYKQNEVIAVAQSYKAIHNEMTNGDHYRDSMYDSFRCYPVVGTKGWCNKLFVRSDLMPHQIKINEVRIERLQDITKDDCLREGLNRHKDNLGFTYYYVNGITGFYYFPRLLFATLINSPGVGCKGLWQSNPYVVVYVFELVK